MNIHVAADADPDREHLDPAIGGPDPDRAARGRGAAYVLPARPAETALSLTVVAIASGRPLNPRFRRT
jgi:hypothetical protein